MEIGAAGSMSTMMAQSQTQSQVGIALLKEAMDTGKAQSSQLLESLQPSSLEPNVGRHVNVVA
ncbi:MAG: YjfB family protein [Zetaproteobacteria bacterium]|nr:YjfB family protein [Zetaproteobacteria bacterium]